MNVSYIYFFLLVLVRISAFLVTAPVFSSRGVPAMFKVGLGIFISLLITPIIDTDVEAALNGTFILLLIQETILGLAIGFIAQLIFTSIQVAGSFIDIQIGFALANVINPQTGAQSPVMGNFKYMFASLLFLSLNIHHIFIDGIISSYQDLPLMGDWLSRFSSQTVMLFVVSTFSKMFVIAFKIAAPIVITLFLADLALGIVARTVPQLNVFVVGLPLKIIINFILFFLIASGFIYMFKELFSDIVLTMKQFIQLMGLS